MIEPARERFPGEQFHDDVRIALVGCVIVQYVNDVWMVQLADDVRLALEPRQGGRVRGEMLRQHFNSDRALEPLVFPPIHRPHAALFKHVQDAIGAAKHSTNQR